MHKTILTYLLGSSLLVSCGGGESAAPEVLEIVITGNDMMKYDKTSFAVKSGTTVRLTLRNGGQMPREAMGHNFILLASGTTAMDFGGAVANPATGANLENSYQPVANAELMEKILAFTKTLGPGEEETIEFVAGAKGEYEFVCTFPGHFAFMRGAMTVL